MGVSQTDSDHKNWICEIFGILCKSYFNWVCYFPALFQEVCFEVESKTSDNTFSRGGRGDMFIREDYYEVICIWNQERNPFRWQIPNYFHLHFLVNTLILSTKPRSRKLWYNLLRSSSADRCSGRSFSIMLPRAHKLNLKFT